MEAFEVRHDADGFHQQSDRYRRIEALNAESYLLHENSPIQVIQSLHSAGGRRDALTPEYADDLDKEIVERAQRIGRFKLAGNMSPLNGYGPKKLTVEQRLEDAKHNLAAFLSQYDIDPVDVRILRPERDYTTPLSVVNVDTEPLAPDDAGLLRPDMAGDLMYTHSPDRILAARPADCPIVFVSAKTSEGPMTALLHLAWLGVAHGYVKQAKQAFDDLGVDWSTVRAQITPGGQEASYRFENFEKYNPLEAFPNSEGLFRQVTENERVVDGEVKKTYDFAIDLPAEVYEQVIEEWGIDPYQVFLDTTDTTAPTVGYSSHSRSRKGYAVSGENSRDIVLVRSSSAESPTN